MTDREAPPGNPSLTGRRTSLRKTESVSTLFAVVDEASPLERWCSGVDSALHKCQGGAVLGSKPKSFGKHCPIGAPPTPRWQGHRAQKMCHVSYQRAPASGHRVVADRDEHSETGPRAELPGHPLELLCELGITELPHPAALTSIAERKRGSSDTSSATTSSGVSSCGSPALKSYANTW